MEPRYLTIASDLERKLPRLISAGTTRLPSETELCLQYSCSRQTIRSALQHLLEKKLIVKYKGSGTYISTSASRGRVVMILPSRNEYIFSAIHQTARRFFAARNLDLTCVASGNRILEERRLLTELLRDPPAGLLLFPAGPALAATNADLLQQLTDTDVPIVALRPMTSPPASVVTISADLRGGSYELALWLMQRRQQRVQAVLPIAATTSAAQLAGLLEASVKSGSGFEESDVLWLSDADITDLQNSHYEPLASRIRGHIPRGTALFCGNDEIAYHMIKLLAREGYSVPEDLSITGFDNSYFCTVHTTSITSVGSADTAVTDTACRALLQLITGRAAEAQLLPMKIFERMSTDLRNAKHASE